MKSLVFWPSGLVLYVESFPIFISNTIYYPQVPLGLGNTIIVQTTTIALLAHVERKLSVRQYLSVYSAHLITTAAQMAIALGFAQLWRCVGQVAGVAIPSAIFQQLIGRELAARITGPGAEEVCMR